MVFLTMSILTTIKEVIKMVILKEIKSKLKNNGDMVLIPNNKNSIYIHYGNYTFNKRMKYFLDYNGIFIQSNYTLKPIINKLNKILKEV
jgi:hypothetical protein